MDQQVIQVSNFRFPSTHLFVYKGQKYPFNFEMFKHLSKTLYNKQNELQNRKEIDFLLDENESYIDLSPEDINNFIQFCQLGRCIINNQNVIHLNYLSKIYEVDELKTATDNYISAHKKDLQLEMLKFLQNSQNNTESIEESISSNLVDYLEREEFLSLSIPVQYRIFTKFYEKNDSKSDEENQKIAGFLFKCLDKFGKNASVLFSFIDFSKFPSEYLKRLLMKKSTEFDFHFINSSFMKSIYETSNELLQKIQILDEFKEEMNKKVQEQSNENGQLRTEIQGVIESMNEKFQEQNRTNDQLKAEFQTINETINQKVQEQCKENDQLKTEIQSMKEEMNQKFQEQNRENDQLKTEIHDMKNKLDKMNTSIENVYPVGSIYMSVKNIDPSNLFAGKWLRWGQGRVPVGVNESGTFDSVEKIGGSEKHQLSTSEIPSHGGHIPNMQARCVDCLETTYYLKQDSVAECYFGQYVIREGHRTVLRSFSEGGNGSHNNLQPYITCYMWKRIERNN